MLDNNQWRLGHRRPWWQWNVLTLFAILFVLVWVREFFGVSYNMILLVCSLIVFLWLVVPIGSTAAAPRLPQIESQPSDASNDDSEDELA
jgi:Na+/melibiose symporter-like transporter